MRAMRDSGLGWLGEIPAEWSIVKGKHVFALLQRPVRDSDGVITCFRDGEVTLRSNRRTEGFTVALKEIGYQGIEPGDLVVHGMDGFAGSIGISDSRGKASPVLNVLDSTQNKKFLMYYLRALAYREVYLALADGIRVRSCNLSWKKIGSLPIALPSPGEQLRIVSYLDEKCAQVDRAIEAAEGSIEEYKLLFSSEIEQMFRTVSGRTKMTRVSTLITDGDHQAPPRSDEGVPFLVISNISSGHIDFTDTDFVSEEYYLSIAEEQRPQKGDLLVTVTGSYGIPVVVDNDRAFCFQRHIALVRPSIDVQYLRYALKTQDFKRYCDQVVTGAAQKTLTLTHLRAYRVQLATESQQKLIAAKLADCELQIDRAIAAKQAIIADLKAYKQSLIYEVVTGKREV